MLHAHCCLRNGVDHLGTGHIWGLGTWYDELCLSASLHADATSPKLNVKLVTTLKNVELLSMYHYVVERYTLVTLFYVLVGSLKITGIC